MSKPLTGAKIAILVANGFNEQDLTHTQRALQALGGHTRIIGMDQGLVNSWTGESWGHHFASDNVLSAALAADYSMLIVPGGRRSIEKLKLTAHTRRFIGGFMDAGKPVALFDDASELLAFADRASGKVVSAPLAARDALKEAGAQIEDADYTLDGNLISGYCADINEYVDAVISHFSTQSDMKAAA